MKKQFIYLTEQYPALATTLIYSKVIRQGEYTKTEIEKNFKLLDKKDYEGVPKGQLLKFYKNLNAK